jgi:hypothetical protein
MLITFFNSEGIIHKEFVLLGRAVSSQHYLGVNPSQGQIFSSLEIGYSANIMITFLATVLLNSTTLHIHLICLWQTILLP